MKKGGTSMADGNSVRLGRGLGMVIFVSVASTAMAAPNETATDTGAQATDTGEHEARAQADTAAQPTQSTAVDQVAQPTPARPDWLNSTEQEFLDSTGGLRPIATYDSDSGLVTIKLKKPGLTFDDIFEVAIGPTYDYYKRTDLVETSFRGEMDGKQYLFTGTIAKKYILGGSITVASVPVVTRFTQSRKADHITITWQKAGDETARRFLNKYKDRLAAALKGAGVDEDLDEYLEDILGDLSDTDTIWGRHEYYPATGYYIYQQKALMASAVANLIASVAGESDIKGAALKIGYQVLREPDYAGPPGEPGKKVVDMSGDTICAGR